MLSITTNLSSLIVQSSMNTSTNKLNQAIERMSTGFKINHAKDNAANYSINTSLSSKISAYQIAEDNCSMGLDMVQTASSSLETMSDLTSRLRALATQAQNGTYGDKSLDAINSEAQAIVQELNRIKNTTTYNGVNLLSSEGAGGSGAAAPTSSQFIEEVTKRDTSAMTTLASVDENTALSSGTYSISTAEELAKLATMTNAGLIGENTEFVLANDIDLSAYSTGEGWTPIGNSSNKFIATFDGNGYVVSNLYINRSSSYKQGLFGSAIGATIKNVGIADCEVTGGNFVGGLVGEGYDAAITNCYATGSVAGSDSVGGLVGSGYSVTISNCYATGSVTGEDTVGGLVGDGNCATITNCYATGSVTSNNYVGGFAGAVGDATITNCYATGSVTGNNYVGGFAGHGYDAALENVYYTDTTGQTTGIGSGTPTSETAQLVTMSELDELIVQGILPNYKHTSSGSGSGNGSTGGSTSSGNSSALVLAFQVGINSSDSSQISLSIAPLDISALDGLDMSSTNALSTIDEVLKTINDQQTNFGAIENRLESALEQIGVAYDNLVSTQSTIRDADVAEESSEYIRNQILQQAAATLMATANQSPSIALQLL